MITGSIKSQIDAIWNACLPSSIGGMQQLIQYHPSKFRSAMA